MSRTVSRLFSSLSLTPARSSRAFTSSCRPRQQETTLLTNAPSSTGPNAITSTSTSTDTTSTDASSDRLDATRLLHDIVSLPYTLSPKFQEPFHLHCYSTKHNTHVTLTNGQRNPLISISCGNLGFRKGARGSYEAAFQTSSWVMRKMLEKGCFEEKHENYIAKLEVVLRGYAEGRQAFVQALMGIEGRLLRPKVVKVSDGTRIKFGGARSPNPRRLG